MPFTRQVERKVNATALDLIDQCLLAPISGYSFCGDSLRGTIL